MKTEISICTGLMLNDHSNPYIESTTVLSDRYFMAEKVVYLLLVRSQVQYYSPIHLASTSPDGHYVMACINHLFSAKV